MYFIGGIVNILKKRLQKNPLKMSMYRKCPFVVEFFDFVDSFGCNCTQSCHVCLKPPTISL
jgi:hypothetical protein